MNRILVSLLLAACVGCTTAETMMKGAASFAIDGAKAALEEKWPGLKSDLMDSAAATAKEVADKAVEKAVTFSAEKTVKVTDAVALAVANQAGINPTAFDFDSDGKYDDGEMAALHAAIKEKKDLPWWLGLLEASGALALIFTGGKTARRYISTKEAKTKK